MEIQWKSSGNPKGNRGIPEFHGIDKEFHWNFIGNSFFQSLVGPNQWRRLFHTVLLH
jgi:hypothetical protein